MFCTFFQKLDQKTEECANVRVELEEKRASCLKLQTQLQEMDERFFTSQAKSKEELGRELRVSLCVRLVCCLIKLSGIKAMLVVGFTPLNYHRK